MQIKVTGKNLDVGDALREHIESRLQQIQQKYFEGTVHAHVTVEKQRSQFHTDCAVHLATGLVLPTSPAGTQWLHARWKEGGEERRQFIPVQSVAGQNGALTR